MTVDIAFLGTHRNRLGESPLWDGDRVRLWWVDAVQGILHAAAPDGTPLAQFHYDQPIGSVGLSDRGLVAAMGNGFHQIDADTGTLEAIYLPPSIAAHRFNDGKADRFGRFLSGQMHIGDASVPAAGLWRLDPDGVARRIETGIAISNAICFSPDGTTLYFADSLEGTIRRHAYDAATGLLGPRECFVDCRPYGSGPDGATVDADGRVWVALVLAQAIACFSPEGTLLQKIDVPIPYPSCPAFGGVGLDTLYVTTISNSGHRLVTDHTDGGRILQIRGLGATGLAEGRYVPDNHIQE